MPTMSGDETSMPEHRRAHHRARRRRRRKLVVLILAGPVLFLLGLVIVTQTPVARMLIVPRLERALGASIKGGSVRVTLGGDVALRGLSMRVPDVKGPAGTWLKISMDADVDWLATLRGEPRISRVVIHDMLVRLSTAEDGSINLAGLAPMNTPSAPPSSTPPGGGGGGSQTPLPHIEVRQGTIEFGEHGDDGSYTSLKRITAGGVLVPKADGGYDIRLRQTGGVGHSGVPVSLTGTLQPDGLQVRLENLTLDDWPAASVPSSIRDIFERLDLKGRITRTTFSYSKDEGIGAELDLDGVALNLPLSEAGEADGPPLRMTDNNGTLTFSHKGAEVKVTGLLGDLPYEVNLKYEGLDADGAFRCEFTSQDFVVEKNPELLPWAPRIVLKRLRTFSSPTALMNTRVVVSRGQPSADGPGPLTYNGTIQFSKGQAAYEYFPYLFTDLTGLITFDNEAIDLVHITGSSESGATLFVTGRIESPGWDAGVDLHIEVTGAPVDEQLADALGVDRREVIDRLFNSAQYARLLDAGLVLTPEQAQALHRQLTDARLALARAERDGTPQPRLDEMLAEIARIQSELATPEFDFSGVADISVRVIRPRGPDTHWSRDVLVKLPTAGLLPEAFPYPIVAENMALRIGETTATLEGGRFRGLTGATAEVKADIALRDDENNKEVSPDISIDAQHVPVDEILLHALPEEDNDTPVRRLLRQMHFTGAASAKVHIARVPGGDVGFSVVLEPGDLAASPTPDDVSRLLLPRLAGSVHVTGEKMDIDLSSPVLAVDRTIGEVRRRPVGEASVRASFVFADEDAGREASHLTTIRAKDIETSAPIEDIVAVVWSEAAVGLRQLRRQYNPSGLMDVAARVVSEPGQPVSTTIKLTNMRGLAFDALEGRFELAMSEGSVHVVKEGPDRGQVLFDQTSAPFTFNGEPGGTLTASGTFPLDTPGDTARTGRLNIDVADGRFDTELIRRVIRRGLGASLSSQYEAMAPEGLFNARLGFAPRPDVPGLGEPTGGWVEPHRLTLTTGGERVVLDQMHGRLTFAGRRARFEGLSGEAQEWSFVADGTVANPTPQRVELDTDLSITGRRLSPDLAAVMPEALRLIFGQLDLHVDGPLSMEHASVHLVQVTPEGGATRRSGTFAGTVRWEGAGLDVGVPITDVRGVADATFRQPDSDDPPEYDVRVLADALRFSGVKMTGGRVRISNGSALGHVLVPLLSATCHEGRVAGTLQLRPTEPIKAGVIPPRRYTADVRWAGIGFAPAIAELSESLGTTPEDRPAAAPDQDARVEGHLDLTGIVGDPTSRQGRGMIQVAGGHVVRLPLALPLIEMSNLALPTSEQLDYAKVDFLVHGGRVTFEELSAFSKSVSLFGYGTMTWPGLELDLYFNSRRAHQIPLISTVVEGIRSEIVTAHVTGRLGRHKIVLRQLGSARRLITGALGKAEADPIDALDRVSRQAERDHKRRSHASRAPVQPR